MNFNYECLAIYGQDISNVQPSALPTQKPHNHIELSTGRGEGEGEGESAVEVCLGLSMAS